MEETKNTVKPLKRRLGGPGGKMIGTGEKPKDLVGTWKKLLIYCRKYTAQLIFALVLAVAGTVLTLAGPDKLSDITDTVTEGIIPDTDMITEISEKMQENISDNFKTVIAAISENLTGIPGDIEVNGVTIPVADQMAVMQAVSGLDASDESEMSSVLSSLPESVRDALYTDIEVSGTTITRQDQLDMAEILSNVDQSDSEALLEAFDNLPASVYGLVEPSIDMDRIFKTCMILVTFFTLSWIFTAAQGWIMSTVTQRVSKSLRTDISYKINKLPMSFYNQNSTGDILSRVTNDVDTIAQSLNQSIRTMVTAVVQFVGCLILMLLTNVWMTLAGIASCLIGFVFILLIMGRSQKYFNRQQRHLGALNGHIEESYTGHLVIKAYNGEEKVQNEFNAMNKDLVHSSFMAQSLAGLMMPIMTFIGNLGYVAVCVVGGALALNGMISFGVIVAFMMYVRYFTSPLAQIAQSVQMLQSAAAAGERVFEFLEAEEMEDETGKLEKLENFEGRVDFKHVRFGYEDTDTTVIHDFSATALPGKKVAIVGPTGAGKTTLVNLLMRFHEIQGGEIDIDGISTKDMKRELVHSQFCMVLQDTWLFEGTARENLIYCTKDVSDEKMRRACRAVGLDHFIRTLPKGYDTVLNDQVNLSQGQMQQLTIARAMIADKPMLILDEATSSVDTRTEAQIQSAMDKLMENRTSFVIAHRLSTIRNADLILVLRDGDIVESGTHEELLAKNGFYAELYNSQFDQAS